MNQIHYESWLCLCLHLFDLIPQFELATNLRSVYDWWRIQHFSHTEHPSLTKSILCPHRKMKTKRMLRQYSCRSLFVATSTSNKRNYKRNLSCSICLCVRHLFTTLDMHGIMSATGEPLQCLLLRTVSSQKKKRDGERINLFELVTKAPQC